ncbi:DUF6404 family protein [Klebsiella pneumoniae]
MDFEVRKQKALAIMVRHNMFKCNYAPPLIRFLWWLGVKIPPLPFASFWQVFGLMAGSFSVMYGLLMYLMVWRPQGMSPLFACAVSLIMSVLFGLTMAFFYLWLRRVHKLPDWKDL